MTVFWTAFLSLTAISFVMQLEAHAFGLTDHEAITRRAAEEFSQCFPDALTTLDVNLINATNIEEDINLIRKWGGYSHFFHPEKKLEMRRKPSDERIVRLEAEMETVLDSHYPGARPRLLATLGHVLHHVQDAASPPHVVPVNHWLTDGFESFETGVIPPASAEEMDCRELARAAFENPTLLLSDTAKATLRNVRAGFPALRNGTPVMLSWANFWIESQGSEFGNYGYFGNRFGVVTIDAKDALYEISRDTYQGLRGAQMRLAVQATKKAFAWARLTSRAAP